MKIKWGVEDGYVGKDRPQYLEIPDDEFEECESKEEEDEIIEEWVSEAFYATISYYWERQDG